VRHAALTLTVVLTAAVAAACGGSSDDDVVRFGSPDDGGIPTAPEIEGDTLPDVTVTTLDGEEASLRDLAGTPMVVNMWFSTCVPCKKELPDFAEVDAELGDAVRFVGLNLQDTPQRAEQFARDAGVEYEIVLDPEQQSALALDVAVFPSTLFVDPSGRIVDLHQGALSADELRAQIAESLAVTA
jgi:thiol-disulfide isomerase/thioredoxin